eukprot:3137059-Heterocapsa_arctica.AAC.1
MVLCALPAGHPARARMAALWMETARSAASGKALIRWRDHARLDRDTSVERPSPCSWSRAILARARASLAARRAFPARISA